MGKSIKKAVKSVTKSVSKVVGGGSSMQQRALEQQMRALEQQQMEARLALQRSQADLSAGNKATVIEGAAAMDASGDGGDVSRKRKGASSLSAALGLGGV